ncbi:MAG TPA: preprotein translocase subunit SecG, partial [Acidimicrobiales bacterium]|nr:preprotein translocase subunit SecG [Acidimicrobiales bacterium]
MITWVVIAIHVVLCVTLVVSVLLHSGKGGGLSEMFGGGVGSAAAASSVVERNLDRFTVFTAIAFAFTTMILAIRLREPVQGRHCSALPCWHPRPSRRRHDMNFLQVVGRAQPSLLRGSARLVGAVVVSGAMVCTSTTGANAGTLPYASTGQVPIGTLTTINGVPNQILNPGSPGTPKVGGTLTVLGTSDVDNALDPNIGYYTLDYVAYQLYERQLYTYPSIQGQTFSLAPDLATGPPTITDGGLKYAVTIRQGAMWNTSPPRQVSAADVVLGVKRSCNPTYPFGGQPDFADILVGYTTFCSGFAKVSSTVALAQKAYIY